MLLIKQTTCPDCGAVYAANELSCPTCGCPNDNYLLQKEESQPKVSAETVNSNEDDFNENGQFSPFSPTSWFFTTPWPLNHWPERKMFEKAHPFLGWLFGPWYLTCKSNTEKEEYAVINNIFYLFNLIFKCYLYKSLWTFFKGLPFILLYLLVAFLIFVSLSSCYTYESFMTLMAILMIWTVIMGVFGIVINCFGMGKALHRYWPSIHQTWRRINKRYWKAMQNQK